MGRQQGHIFQALAQGGQIDFHHVEAVKQVLAKRAFFHQSLQAAVGGRQHTHVRLDGRGAAHPFETAVLQDAQQLDLHGGGNITHLVQKQGPAFGHLESSLALADGGGEGALFMSEQLAFQQVFRQGGAVDGHQGTGAVG